MDVVVNAINVRDRSSKKTVAIVGFSTTTRHLAPWEDTDVEIWGMNEAYKFDFMQRWDRWFQLHPHSNFSRLDNHNDPDHYEWLKKEHPFPIYMQEEYSDVPASVRFPIERITELTQNKYFRSSMAYLLAFAVLEGFERIEVYGIDMRANSEYWYQRPNMEYLIGYFRGMGVDIYVPERADLLSVGKMYAYEDMTPAFKTQLEGRAIKMANTLNQVQDSYNESVSVAEFLELCRDGEIPDKNKFGEDEYRKPGMETLGKLISTDKTLAELVELQRKYARKNGALLNHWIGRKEELKELTDFYDNYNFEKENGNA